MKIKVKKNKVSQGSGALSSELSLAFKALREDREHRLPALPASGGGEPLGPWAGGGGGPPT